jgi:hypothetical protein
MKKDIPFEKVKDVAIAVVRESNDNTADAEWSVYLLNLKDVPLEGVIVASKGYGELEDGEKVKTSQLRQLFDKVEQNNYVKIEPIDSSLFKLNNEFWVSFWIGKDIYDKKYVFVTESIVENNFIDIPIINKRGVMIK